MSKFGLNSIKFKVSILYSTVLGVILVVFSTVLYWTLAFYLYQNIDTDLKLKSREILSTIESYTDAVDNRPGSLEFAVGKAFFYDAPNFPVSIFEMGKVKRLDDRWTQRADALRLGTDYAAFIFNNGAEMVKSKNFPAGLADAFTALAGKGDGHAQTRFHNVQWQQQGLRIFAVPFADSAGGRDILAIGASLGPAESLLHSLRQAVFLGIPLVLVLTSFVGFVFVRRILDPIEEIAQTANRITYEDLSSRVQVQHVDSEIENVVASFNDMIGRLEQSFKHINEFSSQVAHELKTPLAIIRGECELALSQDRSLEDYKTTLRINLEETNRMRQTIEDLLLLARLDYQPELFQFQTFDFMDFFKEIGEQTRILAEEKGLHVKVEVSEEKALINADRLHLRRMFFNVINNAMKFTLVPGQIELAAVCKRNEIAVTVSDTGVGIPEEELPKIFDKFYHSDRTGQADGTSAGLGLSIVQAILKVHKGRIQVKSQVNMGTTFQIILPV